MQDLGGLRNRIASERSQAYNRCSRLVAVPFNEVDASSGGRSESSPRGSKFVINAAIQSEA